MSTSRSDSPFYAASQKAHTLAGTTEPAAVNSAAVLANQKIIAFQASDTAITKSANDESQTATTAAKDDDDTSTTLTLVEQVSGSSPTAWQDFFAQKKYDFAKAIQRVNDKRRETRMAAFKKTLRSKTGGDPEEKTMTIDEALDRVTDLDSFESEVSTLIERFSKKNNQGPNWLERQITRLRRGAERVKQFQNGISSAVQFDPTGAASLSWGLILIVIQFSCLFAESTEMFNRVLETLAEVHMVLPSLEEDLKIHDRDTDLLNLLFTIYECYVKICIAAIEYSTKLDNVFHKERVSTQPGKVMNILKADMEKCVSSFDRRTKQKSRETISKIYNGANEHEENNRRRHETTLSAIDEVRQEVKKQRLIDVYQDMNRRGPESSREVHLPVQSLTMPRNEDFTGREETLEALHSLLISGNHNSDKPSACCLQGIGGMGKTEVALEFAYRHLDHWKAGVFWVAADTNQETELLRTFCDIGSALGIVSTDEFDDRNVIKVKKWLQETDKNWLIVFDGFMPGADSAEWKRNLDRIWPFKTNAMGCGIIVTTQAQINSRYGGEVIHIDPLDDDQGLRLLFNEAELKQLTAADRETAVEITRELGGSALFLKLARESRNILDLSLEHYLNQIRSSSNLLLAKKKADDVSESWRYTKAAYKALDLTLNYLSTDTRDLLDMLAFMHHEDINEFIFVGQPEANSDSEGRFLDNLHDLKRIGLVKINASHAKQKHRSLRIHRAIQVALLMELNHDLQRREAAFRCAIQHLRASYPEASPLQIPNAVASIALRLVLPHVLNMVTCFERASPKLEGGLELARLVIDVGGMDCYDRGLIKESYRLNRAALGILKPLDELIIDSSLSDAFVMQGLCTDFMALSKREEGLEVRQQALQVRQRLFRNIPKDQLAQDDKIRLYNCYTDLSCSLQQINDFDGVKDRLTQCYERYKEWGTEVEEPYEYSKYYNQFAYVLLYENRNDEAVEYAEKAYKLAELSSPGTNYPWLYKFDHANILWQHGDRKQEAFELLKTLIRDHSEELLASYSEILNLGMEQNLGIMAYFLGDLDLAESQLRGLATRTLQCAAWPNENVIRGNYYLSQVLKAKQTTHEEGLSLEQDVMSELMTLLKNDTQGRAEPYAGDYPMLFDYLVHWEFRLVTPRKLLPVNDLQTQFFSLLWLCPIL